jgi:hypothetical protein
MVAGFLKLFGCDEYFILENTITCMRISMIIISAALVITTVLISGCIQSINCKISDPKHCTYDSDCMCSTNPCFFGNKEYLNTCGESLGQCPDMCGFGMHDTDFKYVCENNQCTTAVYNLTTGNRINT